MAVSQSAAIVMIGQIMLQEPLPFQFIKEKLIELPAKTEKEMNKELAKSPRKF